MGQLESNEGILKTLFNNTNPMHSTISKKINAIQVLLSQIAGNLDMINKTIHD